jgi:hypothetical protein
LTSPGKGSFLKQLQGNDTSLPRYGVSGVFSPLFKAFHWLSITLPPAAPRLSNLAVRLRLLIETVSTKASNSLVQLLLLFTEVSLNIKRAWVQILASVCVSFLKN